MSFLRTGVSIHDNGGFGINCDGSTVIFEYDFGTTSTMSGNTLGRLSPECIVIQTDV